MYLKYNAPGIDKIVSSTFAGNRKDVKIKEFRPMNVNSYWSEGSKEWSK